MTTKNLPRVYDVEIGALQLPGTLALPPTVKGLVVFAHGSGSSRKSPRNQQVAQVLRQNGLATLLFDLLTEEEARESDFVFDIPLLAERTAQAVDWTQTQGEAAGLPVGLFGASTGAAAALVASVLRADVVRAVVSRGGRADLAKAYLQQVEAPTLLIVGGRDDAVIELNQRAYNLLGCEKRLEIVRGATHLFEEPGTLEKVSKLASAWFLNHFQAGAV